MTASRTGSGDADLADRIARLSPEKRELLQRRMGETRISGFDAVARTLRSCGVTHIYGVAGQPTEKILPACARQQIRPIGVYHQTSAVCMALAQNYQAGRLVAATLVSSGPAATNAITGLLVAHDNCWPTVVLGGNRASFQRLDAIPLVEHVTKYAVDVPSADSIAECVQTACRQAVSGRPGPAYVQLHEDALNGSTAWPPDSSCVQEPIPSATADEVDRVADALLSAKQPALILGKGIRWTVKPDHLRELIEILKLPFITSPMGRGFVPEDHPLCFNQGRAALQAGADAVLCLGTRLDWPFRHGAELAPDARVIRVDICAHGAKAAGPVTEFIHSDAGEFVTRLLVAVQSRHHDHGSRSNWLGALEAAARESRRLLAERTDTDEKPISPYRMMKEIRDALPRDAICIREGNVSMMAAQAVIPGFLPALHMDAGTSASMGISIPFGIGAKMACPDRPVVVVSGDYGFSLCAMEMEVCVRHNIPIVVLVANNQGNNGSNKQNAYFPGDDSELITMFQPGLQYEEIMKLFGGQGETVTEPDRIGPAVEEAIASGRPACINVVIASNVPMPNAWGQQVGLGEVQA